MKVNIKKIANYSLLPTAILVTIALGLYSIIQRFRFFYVQPNSTTFNAVKDLGIHIDRLKDKYKLAEKRPELYQELYIINIVVLLLIVTIISYYFMDWELLVYALIDIFTV